MDELNQLNTTTYSLQSFHGGSPIVFEDETTNENEYVCLDNTATLAEWKQTTGGTGVSSLFALTDTNISGSGDPNNDNHYLGWDDGTNFWVNRQSAFSETETFAWSSENSTSAFASLQRCNLLFSRYRA